MRDMNVEGGTVEMTEAHAADKVVVMQVVTNSQLSFSSSATRWP